MNHCVPTWHIDGASIPFSPEFISKTDTLQPIEKEVQELVWRNGRLTTQNLNQKTPRPGNDGFSCEAGPETFCVAGRTKQDPPESGVYAASLVSADPTPPPFIQEDEMASWLHYPLEDTLDYRDLFPLPAGNPPVDRNSQAPVTRSALGETALRPAVLPPRPHNPVPESKIVNFSLFASKTAGSISGTVPRRDVSVSGCSESARVASTIVDSCEDVPIFTSAPSRPESKASVLQSEMMDGCKEPARSTSDPHGSTLVSSPDPRDRKRKARETEDSESHSEGADETVNAKEAKRSRTKRRNRAAEIHNLSERNISRHPVADLENIVGGATYIFRGRSMNLNNRRRDRINEKMRALQELIPRCNKSDKASMLDEAIEYLKSLQLQVQMMSMGCSMPQMMYPGPHPLMPPIGMGMGMGMVPGSTHPVMPFPPVMPRLAVPSPDVGPLYPNLPMPGVHMQVPVCTKSDQMSSPLDPLMNPTQPATLAEYQQYLSQFHAAPPTRVPLPFCTSIPRSEEPPPSSK